MGSPEADPKALQHRLRAILRRQAGNAFTAAVVRVECVAGCVDVAHGAIHSGPEAQKVISTTPFDLASLTKLFTATAVLRLVTLGQLQLDDRVKRFLPEFAARDRDRVTVRCLLTHTSGLPAQIHLYGRDAPADPWKAVLECPLQSRPGTGVVYSDVGFMVLGKIAEIVAAQPLNVAVALLTSVPLGLEDVEFGPCPAAPATEYDSLRGRRLQGEVHDENAAVLGGVAGHAGLFGSAASVARLARIYLSPPEGFLLPALARDATSELARTGDQRRGLGWKLRSMQPEAPEYPFAADSFGHYGFTGTSVWTDPTTGCTTVLLANRVYFGRQDGPIAALRREVFGAVSEWAHSMSALPDER